MSAKDPGKRRRRLRTHNRRARRQWRRQRKYVWHCEACGRREPGQDHDWLIHGQVEQRRRDEIAFALATYRQDRYGRVRVLVRRAREFRGLR